MSQVRALFVDPVPDEHAVMRVLANRAGKRSIAITSADSPDDALRKLEGHDIVLIGDHGADTIGLGLIQALSARSDRSPIIYLIDGEDEERSTAALVAGASDVIPRELLSPELLARSVTFALEHAAATRRIAEDGHRTRALMEALPDLVLRLNGDGVVVGSYGATAANGVAGKSGTPLTVGHMMPSSAASSLLREVTNAISSGDLQILEFTTDDRTEIEARISPIRLSDEVVVLLRDVTARNTQRRHLLETIESKDEMLAAIAHELRSPLSAVIGFTQLLTTQRDSLSENEIREMLGRILGQANDIQGMVEDLLTAARHDIGKLVVASVRTSLNAQVAQVLESLPDEQANRISVVKGHGICVADPGRVRQIIRNLIANALRYGGPNIEVSTFSTEYSAVVAITDDGQGIPAERVEQLFVRHVPDRFNPESVGLGLALSRDLADLMKGELSHSRVGAKTVFRLALPKTRTNASDDNESSTGSSVDVHGLDVRGVLLENNSPLQLQ